MDPSRPSGVLVVRAADGARGTLEARMKNTSDAPKAGGTKPIPGAHTDPSSIPQPSHGGDNSRDAPHTEGKDGNGAQKRQQQHKS